MFVTTTMVVTPFLTGKDLIETQELQIIALLLNHLLQFQEANIDETSDDDSEEDLDVASRCEKYTIDGQRVVSKMPLNLSRTCLVEHFDIRFKRNSIIWPKFVRKTYI